MRPADTALHRHDLVWVDPNEWRSSLRPGLPDPWLALLDAWLVRGLPAVVRRQGADGGNSVALGVALSPGHGKLKIPFDVARAALRASRPPLRLDEVIASAPAGWRPPLQVLLARAEHVGVRLAVYGSLAWTHLSGESYLTPSSDVDLLWRPRDAEQLEVMLSLLACWQTETGLRADGEVLFADGSAVSWQEIATWPRKVLLKRNGGVELRDTQSMLHLLDAQPC